MSNRPLVASATQTTATNKATYLRNSWPVRGATLARWSGIRMDRVPRSLHRLVGVPAGVVEGVSLIIGRRPCSSSASPSAL